jgi:uncharacterized protein YqgC (DUF456 family)
MSWGDPKIWGNAGVIGLIVGLIGYLVVNRIPSLRRFRRIICVLGVLLFVVGSYIDRRDLVAAFKAGWDAAGPADGRK